MRRDELRKLSRDELVELAASRGVRRPAVLTKAELIDELQKQAAPHDNAARGWLGRARDLLAAVVERGLHLPETARLLLSQGEQAPMPSGRPPPPLPTVTLAEIYAAQGHTKKALKVLDEVLNREPDNDEAQRLYDRLGGAPRTSPVRSRTNATATSATTVSATAVSATAVSAAAVSATAVSAKVVSATTISATAATPVSVAKPKANLPQSGAFPVAASPAPAPPAPTPITSLVSDQEPSTTKPVNAELVSEATPAERADPEDEVPPTRPESATVANAPQLSDLESTLESESLLEGAGMASVRPTDGSTTSEMALANEILTSEEALAGASDVETGDFADDLVALATDPRTAYVYWELRPLHFARARWDDPKGSLVLRVLTVTPDNANTVLVHKDLPVLQMAGDCFLRGLPPGAELRLCIGWLGDEGFAPLVVAPEMQMPREMLNLGGFAVEAPLHNALQQLTGHAVNAAAAPLVGSVASSLPTLVADGASGSLASGSLASGSPAPGAPSAHTGVPLPRRSQWPALPADQPGDAATQARPVGGSSNQYGNASDLIR